MTDIRPSLRNDGLTTSISFLNNRAKRRGRTALAQSAANTFSGCIPTVVPWPHASDVNGIAYPAGLVGVRFGYQYQTPDPEATMNAALVAVPDTLPVGYTARPIRDHLPQTHVGNSQKFGLGFNPYHPSTYPSDYPTTAPWYLRSDTGMSTYNWFPENKGNNAFYTDFPGTAGNIPFVDLAGATWMNSVSAGMRYFRFRENPYFGTVGWKNRYRIGYSTSVGTSTTMPSTILDEWVFTQTAGLNAFSIPQSGPYNAPVGQKVYFAIVFQLDTGSGYGFSGSRIFPIMGARVDIPFPFTCTGLDASGGHLIAPGGTF